MGVLFFNCFQYLSAPYTRGTWMMASRSVCIPEMSCFYIVYFIRTKPGSGILKQPLVYERGHVVTDHPFFGDSLCSFLSEARILMQK